MNGGHAKPKTGKFLLTPNFKDIFYPILTDLLTSPLEMFAFKSHIVLITAKRCVKCAADARK